MIEPTDEMFEAFELAAWPRPDSETIHIREGLAAVLALISRDYLLTPICNAELMPGVACKRTAINPRHTHEATMPATGNWVEWK